jgi:hypothetical protein
MDSLSLRNNEMKNEILPHPTCEGFWIMKDEHRYDWEPVSVFKKNGEWRIMYIGVSGDWEIPCYVKEWIKLNPPNLPDN